MTDIRPLLVAQQKSLLRYARRLTWNEADAEDLVQATLLQALAQQHQFTLAPGDDARRWLFTLMHNLNATRVRRAIAFGPVSGEDEALSVPVAPPQESRILAREMAEALGGLNRATRELMILAAEGWTYEQLSGRYGIPIGTIRSRLHRGRLRAWQALEDRGASTAG